MQSSKPIKKGFLEDFISDSTQAELDNLQTQIDSIIVPAGLLHTTGDETKDGDLTLNDTLFLPDFAANPGELNNIGVDEFGAVVSVPIEQTSTGDIKIAATNNTGVTIAKGSVVYISGAQGSKATIALALADSNIATSQAVGIVSESIPNNGSGYVVVVGEVDKLNTSAFVNGDKVFISPVTPGGLTSIIPTSPDNVVFIGTVTNAHINQGKIVVNVIYTPKIDRLVDVAITAPADNDLITFENSSGLWKNKAIKTIEGQSLFGAGNIDITKADVGLANADNTSDLNKPVSTAVQTVLNLKEDLSNKSVSMTGNEASNIFYLTAKAIFDWAVGLFVPKTRTVNINGNDLDLSTNREWRVAQGDTGALTYGGITIAGATTVNIGACTGYVVNNETNPAAPTYTYISYAGETNKTVTTIGSGLATYVLLNSSGTIVFQNTFPTSAQRKTHIWLSKVSHPNLSSLAYAINEVDFITSPLSQFRDFFQSINYVNEGIITSPNGANLNFNLSSGTIIGDGINFVADKTTPNFLSVPSQTPASFVYRNQNGGATGFVSLIDPTTYDNGGVTTAVGGGGNRSTNQYVFYAPGAGIVIQRGQVIYATLPEAIAAVNRESFNVYSNLVRNSILIGVISMRHTTTDLSNTSFARFFTADKFGQLIGSVAGISISTLQTAYDNSANPEILTNSTLGAMSFRRGSAADTDSVVEVQNNAGTNTFTVTGAGNTTANSFIKTGGTSAQFLMADGSTSAGSGGTGVAFTPTLTPGANVVSVSVQRASYTQVGDVVSFTVGFLINTTAANTDTIFSLTLPVAKINANLYFGSGTVAQIVSPLTIAPCFFQTTSTTAGNVYIRSTTSGNQSGSITIQYTVA